MLQWPWLKAPLDTPLGTVPAISPQLQQQKKNALIHQLVDDAFAELDPELLRSKVKGSRRRQHCNPLKASFMDPLRVLNWGEFFADPSLPLTVDIGSGQGRFSLLLAKKNAGIANVLGLDIRRPLVEKCNVWANELDLSNMHFMTANATVSLGSLLSTYSGKVELICIMCPDPHFKLRHRKRRIVQPKFVDDIMEYTAIGSQIFFTSDVQQVAIEMRNLFEKHLGISITKYGQHDTDGWLLDNPLGVRTEREIAVLAQNGKMYRAMYQRR